MMRSRSKWVTLALVVILGCGESRESTTSVQRQNDPFPELDAYGEWIDYRGLGMVWQPRVAYDWQPFADGRGVWTDQGWLWYSDEPFGWVVYHYGYWVNEGPTGWLWVPGYEWSPARVRWVVRDDLVGWAPMPPPGRDLPAATSAHVWVTAPPQEFTRRSVGRFRGRADVAPGTQDDTRRPPDVGMIERETRAPVEKERFETEPVHHGGREILRVRMTVKENQPGPPVRQQTTPLPTGNRAPATPPPVKPVVTPPTPPPVQSNTVGPSRKPSSVRKALKERTPPPVRKEKKPPPVKEPQSGRGPLRGAKDRSADEHHQGDEGKKEESFPH